MRVRLCHWVCSRTHQLSTQQLPWTTPWQDLHKTTREGSLKKYSSVAKDPPIRWEWLRDLLSIKAWISPTSVTKYHWRQTGLVIKSTQFQGMQQETQCSRMNPRSTHHRIHLAPIRSAKARLLQTKRWRLWALILKYRPTCDRLIWWAPNSTSRLWWWKVPNPKQGQSYSREAIREARYRANPRQEALSKARREQKSQEIKSVSTELSWSVQAISIIKRSSSCPRKCTLLIRVRSQLLTRWRIMASRLSATKTVNVSSISLKLCNSSKQSISRLWSREVSQALRWKMPDTTTCGPRWGCNKRHWLWQTHPW